MNCKTNCIYENLGKELNKREKEIVLDFVKRMKNLDMSELENKKHVGLFTNTFFDIIRTSEKLKNISYVSGVIDSIEYDFCGSTEQDNIISNIESGVYGVE